MNSPFQESSVDNKSRNYKKIQSILFAFGFGRCFLKFGPFFVKKTNQKFIGSLFEFPFLDKTWTKNQRL